MARLITLGFDDPNEGGFLSGGVITPNGTSVGAESPGVLLITSAGSTSRFSVPNPTEIYMAGTFKCGTPSSELELFTLLGPEIYFKITTANKLTIYRSATLLFTSTATIAPNTIHHLEVHLLPRDSGGQVTVKIDGTQVADYSGDTVYSSESVTRIYLYAPSANTWWDNVVVNDTSGTTNNSWPGQVRLIRLAPRSPGDQTQLTRTGYDLGSNFAQVRDNDGNATTGIEGNLNDTDLYRVDQLAIPTASTINGIIVQTIGKSTSGTGKIAPVVKSGTSQAQGADITLATAGTLNQYVLPTDPATGTAWTANAINNMQVGIKVRS